MNHLIVFQDTYLELIGLERDGPVRKDIMESRMGIDGLVLRMQDEEAVVAGLKKAGLLAFSLQKFNRLLENGEKAEFLAVRLEPGSLPKAVCISPSSDTGTGLAARAYDAPEWGFRNRQTTIAAAIRT